MSYVTAPLGRPIWQITPDTFTDLTAVPLLRAWSTAPGTAVLQFDGDLDAPTVAAVTARCAAVTDAQAVLLQQAAQALNDCRAYLANPAPTQADALAQIKLLTQIVIRLIRLATNELDGTN